MPDDAAMSRRYTFKPREFDRANPLRPQAAAPSANLDAAGQSAPAPAQHKAPHDLAADAPPNIDLRDVIASAAVPGPVLRTRRGETDNDVRELLRDNVQNEIAAGLHRVTAPPPRRAKRRRDYLLLMGVGNALWAVLTWQALRTANPVLLVSAVGGCGMFTASVTWVMWFLMDDY